MTTAAIPKPFLFNFAEKVAASAVDAALKAKDNTRDTYDSKSQTSDDCVVQMGTQLTYRSTMFGTDTEQDDT